MPCVMGAITLMNVFVPTLAFFVDSFGLKNIPWVMGAMTLIIVGIAMMLPLTC